MASSRPEGHSRRRLGGFACAPAPADQSARSAGAKPKPVGLHDAQQFDGQGLEREWLPLRHYPGRAEPVKGAFGVGFAANP
jgi:hypothetical protein